MLGVTQTELFHSITARLLFATKWATPNTRVAVAYLYTRVWESTEDGYLKLARVIQYLACYYVSPSYYWMGIIDASFAVHNNIHSHTGVMLTFGRGAIFFLLN